MLPDFASVSPETKEAVLDCLAELDDARVIAGGTDLLVDMKRGEYCGNVVDIMNVEELKRLSRSDPEIVIGSAVTHAALSAATVINDAAKSLSAACGWIGSPQIRNMGTIGGNLVNASPAADTIPPLLVHDAVLSIESKEGARKERLEDFIIAPYGTSLKPRELLASVHIKGLSGYREGYKRVAKRAAWAISRLSVAWAIREDDDHFADVKLAIGSCTPMPFRPRDVEEFLKGREKNDPVIREAVEIVAEEIRRISGDRPSFVYKMPVVKDLVQKALRG
jgi:CO/xanthine dehydrogenase FAD-binding subunit